jgi:ABC-2 type transport system permease protein
MADKLNEHPSYSAARKWRTGFNVAIGIAALLAIAIMVNYASRKHFFHRWFLSSQTRIQLSGQTLGLLKSITNDVRITLYYEKADPMFNTIAALATEYRLANPRIQVETVDYTRDTVSAQRIKEKYHLDSPTDKNLVIFDSENRVKRINGDALTETTLEAVPNEREREFRKRPVAFKGEMMFSAMLLAVNSPSPLDAYYLVGHGEHRADSQDDEAGYMKFISLVQQNYVKVQPLTLLGTNRVPADCSLLIVAGPKTPIPEVELARIEQYLESGGRLLALFDCTTADKPLGLEDLLAKWGVKVDNHTLLDEQRSVRGQDIVIGTFARHPVVNPLLQSSIHMILPRPVGEFESRSTAADAPKVSELAFTSPDARLNELPDAPARARSVAVAVEKGSIPGVANARGTTRIVVVGDSFFLGNKMIDSAANRDFATYALNWLLDRTQLLEGLGPRPVVEYKLVMTQSQLRSAQWALLGGLPGTVLVLGVLVWLRRRN